MKVLLHEPNKTVALDHVYRKAFSSAEQLFVVSAYLTSWDPSLKLGGSCQRFRIVIGSDFGITKKQACRDLLKWLPANRKADFLVADNVGGFHPKAIFWKEPSGKYYALVGSSNLTAAAFHSNFEANVEIEINKKEFRRIEQWLYEIEKYSVVVSEDWIEAYQEAPANHGRKQKSPKGGRDSEQQSAVALWLPKPAGSKAVVDERRYQIKKHRRVRKKLIALFQRCADGAISSREFYDSLPQFWSWERGNRLQGKGWERQGKSANFQNISRAFLRIAEAKPHLRDDVVRGQIDLLKETGNRARKAFLSEILCLEFPTEYPVLNDPVDKYLSGISFRKPRGASEGSTYIDLARKLRLSLAENPSHPAKNVAELDAVLWKKYGEKQR